MCDDRTCRLVIGWRDDDGKVYCQTCGQHIRVTAYDDPMTWPEKRIERECPLLSLFTSGEARSA